MAIFPCDLDHRPYPGPQATIYPALVNGASAKRRKLRCCPSHFRDLVECLELHAHSAQGDFTDSGITACLMCDEEVDSSRWQFFATVYEPGAERRDFWAVVHDECIASAAEGWGLETYTA